MTVINDLERSIAMAQAARGSYMLFATEAEDQKANQVFKQMAEDMERHVTILESRLDYLNQNNPLNKAHSGEQQGKGKKDEGQGGGQ